MSDQLLDEIKNSIMDMQTQMQSTYSNLSDIHISGESSDKSAVSNKPSVKITMTATYNFVGIEFDETALKAALKVALKEGKKGEFKVLLEILNSRVNEAWKNLSEKIQETTQAKTVELLQGMQIPDDIKTLATEEEEGSAGSSGSTSA